MHSTAQHIAKLFRDFYFGGNWAGSNFKNTLADVTWEEATTQVYDFNTIVTLVYHIHYYVSAALKVLEGGPLDASDKYSFDHPPIRSWEDWENFLSTIWTEAETFVGLVEKLPEDTLWNDFWKGQYGNYHRNIHGIIEHGHYHLGQIALLKKILRERKGE